MGQDDLRAIISKLPTFVTSDLLVGNSTGDDAAVLKIDGDRAIVQTVDFFTPIVDDPRLFGAIAAANSISDIYAMGGEPILGLAIAAFPTDKLPLTVLEEILAGGAEKAAEAGFPVAGGHTIIDDIPKYGLAVTGIVAPDRIVRNSTARDGDILYLTKPIGNGVLVCAHRASVTGALRRLRKSSGPSLDEAINWMLTLNRAASRIMTEVGVNAATDVTGYGLIGHLLEICTGSGVGASIEASSVPVLSGVRELLAHGFVPEGTLRNAVSFRTRVNSSVSEAEYQLMCDAQTSGGLLLSVPASSSAALERRFSEEGLLCAKIGAVTDQSGAIELRR
ncbi:MAG: selenide, water dikinase SelD [Acidobacteriota bacterium]